MVDFFLMIQMQTRRPIWWWSMITCLCYHLTCISVKAKRLQLSILQIIKRYKIVKTPRLVKNGYIYYNVFLFTTIFFYKKINCICQYSLRSIKPCIHQGTSSGDHIAWLSRVVTLRLCGTLSLDICLVHTTRLSLGCRVTSFCRLQSIMNFH